MRSICNRHDNTIVCDECESAVLGRLEKAEARVKELESDALPQADALQHYSTRTNRAEARVAELEAELANRAGCINEAAKVEP